MCGLQDTQIALRQYDEYTRQHSARPAPLFLEVDRDATRIDPLWHVPTSNRVQFTRQIRLAAINTFERPQWTLTAIGQIPQRRDKFWLSNLGLSRVDWFPNRGDFVVWNSYRYGIVDVVIQPQQYWGQTGVWLGLYVLAVIVPEGDTTPLDNVNVVVDDELSPHLMPAPPPPLTNGPAYPEHLPSPILTTPPPLPTNFGPQQ